MLQCPLRGFPCPTGRSSWHKSKSSSTAMPCMARSLCVSCCVFLLIARLSIQEYHRRNIKSPRRSSVARKTLILTWIPWYASRWGACAQSWRNTLLPRGQKTRFWWRCPRVITRLAFTSGLTSPAETMQALLTRHRPRQRTQANLPVGGSPQSLCCPLFLLLLSLLQRTVC